MSEEKVETVVGKEDDDRVDVERIETVSSTSAPWTVRLVFGILGVVFLASAVAAWQFRDVFDGHLAQALPYIIIGLVVIGAGAIVESITTEIWIALIVGVFGLAIAFLIVGRTEIVPNEGALYTIDRITGAVQFCTPDGCLPLKQVSELPKPPAPPPPVEPAPAAGTNLVAPAPAPAKK